MKHLSTLKQEIKREIDRYFKNAKHLLHWIHIDTGAGEHGNHYIEVRGELDYDEMENLADYLNKIVQKYDKEAYFEQVEPGIMRAYLDGLSEAQLLSNRLSDHLSKVNEVSEDPTAIERAILKRESNAFGKLVWALIKPTILSQGGRFIAPNFNGIKPLLIADIKEAIKDMQKEGWDESPEEIAKQILDPQYYDSEVGNYVDTTFLEEYTLLYEKDSSLKVLEKLEDYIADYLYENIKRNYKMLIAAIR